MPLEDLVESSSYLNGGQIEKKFAEERAGTETMFPFEFQTQPIIAFDVSSNDDVQELISIPFLDDTDSPSNQLSSELTVSETPTPFDPISQAENQNVSSYLLSNAKIENTNVLKKKKKAGKVTPKRMSSEKSHLRPGKIKKLEGYSCKLNRVIYQVNARDLDIMEVLDNGIKSVLQKAENGLCSNVRSLRLQLNQIETILGVLKDDRLDLHMAKEVWDEMMVCTEDMLLKAREIVELREKEIFDVDITEELSTCFSQSLTMSSSTPNKDTTKPTKHVDGRFKTKTIKKKPDSQKLFRLSENGENEILTQDLSQEVIVLDQESMDLNYTAPPTAEIAEILGSEDNPVKISRSRVKSKAPFPSKIFSSTQNDSSRDTNRQDSTIIPFVDSSNSTDLSDSLPVGYLASFDNQTLSPISKEGFDYSQMTMTQETLLVDHDSQTLEQEKDRNEISVQFSTQTPQTTSKMSGERRQQLTKLTRFNFCLGPYVSGGVLSSGENKLKMTFRDRVYVASLKPNGYIQMDRLVFSSLGKWFKYLTGKRFVQFPIHDQKSLSFQYDGKPLEDFLDMELSQEKSIVSKPRNRLPLNAELGEILSSPATTKSQDRMEPKYPPTFKTASPNKTLQLVPDESTQEIKTIFLHGSEEYFPTCQCVEQYWTGAQPFPKHLLDEIDFW